MKTVGEILKTARLKKGIKRREIVKKTKISLIYVKALEQNDFNKLPEAAFVKGFIKNYAQIVGLSPTQILAVFRRDYDQNVQGKVVPRDISGNTVQKRIIWNPRTTVIAAILLLSITLAVYFIYQYQLLTAAPKLAITNPTEQEVVTSTLTVRGETDPQATVTINSQRVLVNDDGSFSQALVLTEGLRTITIEATNRSGKTRTVQRTINVQ